jgi:hypothetical protein
VLAHGRYINTGRPWQPLSRSVWRGPHAAASELHRD